MRTKEESKLIRRTQTPKNPISLIVPTLHPIDHCNLVHITLLQPFIIPSPEDKMTSVVSPHCKWSFVQYLVEGSFAIRALKDHHPPSKTPAFSKKPACEMQFSSCHVSLLLFLFFFVVC
mmetsp:Transcript_134/g.489  ORF Transcript_134/g.489 Transcript_134/m.489 type:complete len:119 (+) Transcript_134:1795-2151(+)